MDGEMRERFDDLDRRFATVDAVAVRVIGKLDRMAMVDFSAMEEAERRLNTLLLEASRISRREGA